MFDQLEPQIRQIVECLTNADRQTLFFTATWPREVQQLANSFLNNAVQLKIGTHEYIFSFSSDVAFYEAHI